MLWGALCCPNSPGVEEGGGWYWVNLINSLAVTHISPFTKIYNGFLCKVNVNMECTRPLFEWPPITVSLLIEALPPFPLNSMLNYRDTLSALLSFPFICHWLGIFPGWTVHWVLRSVDNLCLLIEVWVTLLFFKTGKLQWGQRTLIVSEVLLVAIKGLRRWISLMLCYRESSTPWKREERKRKRNIQ